MSTESLIEELPKIVKQGEEKAQRIMKCYVSRLCFAALLRLCCSPASQ